MSRRATTRQLDVQVVSWAVCRFTSPGELCAHPGTGSAFMWIVLDESLCHQGALLSLIEESGEEFR